MNHAGKVISNPMDLKKLLLKEYTQRLRKRPKNPKITVNASKLRKNVIDLKLKYAKKNKSPMFSMNTLEKVLKGLKKNKCSDPEGLFRQLFRPENIGEDLKMSLLMLLNKMKSSGMLAKNETKSLITTIPKKNKSRLSLKNE